MLASLLFYYSHLFCLHKQLNPAFSAQVFRVTTEYDAFFLHRAFVVVLSLSLIGQNIFLKLFSLCGRDVEFNASLG